MTQPELKFDATNGPARGLSSWREERLRQRAELARTLGLPLGKPVEVWLKGSIRLRGELRLREESLIYAVSTVENTEFEIEGVRFFYADLESCVSF